MERFVGATWTFLWRLLLSLWLWWHLGLLETLVPRSPLLRTPGYFMTSWIFGTRTHETLWKHDALAGHSPGTFVAPWKFFFKGPEAFWMLMVPKSMWPVTFGNPGTFFGSWNAFWLLKILVLWLLCAQETFGCLDTETVGDLLGLHGPLRTFWAPKTLELLGLWDLLISPPPLTK